MPTDVVMPQMGESIAEGTIVRWIKKVGDAVDRDEPLFEISTDKVDAEIPSPAAGVVSEIRAKEGDTVPVNSVVAIIGAAGDVKAALPLPASPKPPAPAPAAKAPAPPAAPVKPQTNGGAAQHAESGADALRERSSPLVRKIAKEHNVDISQIPGSGIAGRVTKDDILGFIGSASAASAPSAASAGQTGQVGKTQPPVAAPRVVPMPADRVRGTGAPGDEIVKMSVMRKKIAGHMIVSRRTSAHVHSVFEVNFARVAQIREAKKAEFERAGAKLTYLSFILKAAVDALRAVPVVNASVDGDTVIYHKDVNVGIAVALDWGLIVPVIKQADERNLIGLSRALSDLASRARSKQLKPEEVSGGTFTITNPGVFGALFGMPIINQPQVAILGVGNVEKRPVVIDDAIAIRPMGYLTLGYDHRIIDGAVADEFMSHVKRALENWDPATV
ncbi:MAG: 2-oxo acid dehydrogenase subunit E2 [Acidobacteria bacterium]|nr:2-oxo acid dehydrogenase subunit E2 [Acidobacteriota bacterium]